MYWFNISEIGLDMMNKQLKGLRWKKIVLVIIVLLFLLLIALIFSFYRSIENSKLDHFDVTKNIILQTTEITSIDQAFHFQEEKGYHIVYGHDKQNKEWLIFVPLQKKLSADDVILFSRDSLQSQEQIESEWAKGCDKCALIGSTPAMINEKALWELTYTDEANRYVIEYVSLEDGTTYELMKFQRKYTEKG